MNPRYSEFASNRATRVNLLVSESGEIVGIAGDPTLISQDNLWGLRIEELLDGTSRFVEDMRETDRLTVKTTLRTAEGGRWLDAKGHKQNGYFQIEMSTPEPLERMHVAASQPSTSIASTPNAESKFEPRTRADLRAVLCVDDEEMILRVYRRMFPSSTKVFVARSVKEAIEVLKHHDEIDAILCDVMMPEACGYELFQHLTATNPHLANRLAFITGGVISRTLELAIQYSGAPLGSKPFSGADLDALIGEVLARDALSAH